MSYKTSDHAYVDLGMVLYVVMTRLLSSIVLLAVAVYRVQATGECSLITEDDLLSTDNDFLSTLLVQTYNDNVGPTNPFVELHDIHIVCKAAGTRRDTYRFVSVLVRQTCIGELCPMGHNSVDRVVQYDFQCSDFNEWVPETFNFDTVREDDPEATFDTAARSNCGACAGFLTAADPVTHCRGT